MKWTIIHLMLLNCGGGLLLAAADASRQFVVNTWPFTQATAKAWQELASSDDALRAVESGCGECELERCDGTVGFGGSPDESGESVLDAMIMDGVTHRAGSVAGLRRVKNAIGVARAVMDYTRHTLLVGDLATQFAVAMGFREEDLHTADSMKKWIDWQQNRCQPNFRASVRPDPAVSCGPYEPSGRDRRPSDAHNTTSGAFDSRWWHDTIGMIAVDSRGNMAVGTSSNGAIFKVPGRVGDAPVVGSGAYVDNDVGAACATGDGDIMMRFVPAYQIVESMRAGSTPGEACKEAIGRIIKRYSTFFGALIAADKNGNHGAACHGMDFFEYSFQNDSQVGVQLAKVTCI